MRNKHFVLVGASVLLFMNVIYADAPNGQVTPLTTKWHEDLMFLSRQLVKRHANAFHFISPETFQAEVDRLDAQLPTLNSDQIFVGMDQIVNSIGDGHTYIRIPDDAPTFPVEFERFGDDYRLTQAALAANVSDVIGQKLMAIDGMPIDRVRALLLTLTPADETQALRDLRACVLLNNGLVLYGLGITSNRDHVSYTFETEAGQLTLNLPAGSPMPQSEWLRAAMTVPLYRQHPDEPLWCLSFEKEKAVYCSFQSYKNLRESSRAMLDLLHEKQPQYLILDLRFNKGGDFGLGLKYLIKPIRRMRSINRSDHLFVLIGPRTFSAAMSNSAQFHDRTKALLVGQPIGEKPNSYQEAREMVLPNSHWTVRYSIKFYKFTQGSENLIRPDKEIPETWDDYKSGHDPVLDWVLQQCTPGAPLLAFEKGPPRYLAARDRLFLDRLDLQASPQIPAGDRPIRSPGFGDLLHHHRLRPLAFLVVLLDGRLHSVIANRQNIRMPQGKHQEHVGGPDADALDLSEMRNDFVFGHTRHALKLQQPSLGFFGEVPQVSGFLPRKSDAAHLRIAELENAVGSKRIAGQRGKSIKNDSRRLPIQLLIEDRSSHGVKRRLAKLHAARSYAFDDRRQDGVRFLQVVGRFAHLS